MSRFIRSFFSGSNRRPSQHKFHNQARKKTLNFESLEARRVMYAGACQIQPPIDVDSSVAQICTALTLEEFTAQTGIIIDQGVVVKLPTESGDGKITQVDGVDLVDTSESSEVATVPLFNPVRGDANSDGFIDEQDLVAWNENFTGDLGGNLETPAKTFEQGDFDGDGDVDLNDLGWWSVGYTGPEGDIVDAPPALADEEDAADLASSESSLIVVPIAGDADSDSDVDEDDLTAWTENFTGDLGGNPGNSGTALAQGDFDGDGDTDLNDLGMWSEGYTGPAMESAEESATVPMEAALGFAASEDSSTSLVVNPTAGDADSDGDIDEVDLATWEANFTGDLGGSEIATMLFAQGDFDGDGDVDLNDLGSWAANYTGTIEIGT